MKLTKKEALYQFRLMWSDIVKDDPSWRGDVVAKRESWNNYTDSLCKDRQITNWQYNNWTNPF